ncbi:MATE family efflux transporter [uncultured Algimonas sp.]|uniref:MATE family efflux transporter n=1 Tax=uncultured Algimonas sp. TaxID=1547920 RepID=UPI00260C7023|nr:MATE family efflux transporter [uncultured Algimonas sp.]
MSDQNRSDRAEPSGSSDDVGADGGRALDEGAIWKALLVMAGPMVFGIAAIKSVSMIDTLYVGQLGQDPLAALSFAFPVTAVVLGLSLGLSIAASSVVSRAVGENENENARAMSLHVMILAILIMGAVSLIGLVVTEPLFEAMGAAEDTLGLIKGYMRLWFIAVPFMAVAMMCDFIVRATGNSLWPSIIMTVGSLFNIAITALLVFGLWGLPELGINGAAAGTLIAQVLTAMAGIWMVTWKTGMIAWSVPKLDRMIPTWIDTAKVAVPAALGKIAPPFALTAVTAILATFSEEIVAAFGVATQVQLIAFIPLLALSAAISPIAGQNWGAGKTDRIVKTLKESYWLCTVWAGLVAVPLWMFGADLAGLFNSDNDIPAEAQTYLRIVPFSLFGYGMVICAASAFNGIDEAKRALGYNVARSLILLLPLSWIGSLWADATGVYAGIAAANVLSGLAVGWYAIRWLNRKCEGENARKDAQNNCDHLVAAK